MLLSASPANVRTCIELALRRGLGIELMAFAFPHVLDGDWRALVTAYRTLLAAIPLRSMHGPFLDMTPGSMDEQVNALVMARFRQALEIAAELDVPTVIFHANFIASLRTDTYRSGWTERNVAFFGELAPYAAQCGVTITLENMWEYEPSIIADLLRAVDHPNLRACLDVGHAHLFGEVPFGDWLTTMQPYLDHVHMNNNDGRVDTHHALSDGVLDYRQIVPQLRALPAPPTMTLEMDDPAEMEASLPYFDL